MYRRRRRGGSPSEEDEDIDSDQSEVPLDDHIPPRGRGRLGIRGRGRHGNRGRRGRGRGGNADSPPRAAGFDQAAIEAMARGIAQGLQAPRQMTDLEATSMFIRNFRVPFDGTGDVLDFLNAIRGRIRMAENDAQRLQMVESCMEREALDWFISAIRPVMDTITWAEFERRFEQHYLPPDVQFENRLALTRISRDQNKSIESYTNRFRRMMRFAGPLVQNEQELVHMYVSGLGPEYASMRTQGYDLDSIYTEAAAIEQRLRRHLTSGSFSAGISRFGSQGSGQTSRGVQQHQMTFRVGSGGNQTSSSQTHSGFRRLNRGRHGRGGGGFSFLRSGNSGGGHNSSYSSASSGSGMCQRCGRVHQGPCHLAPNACFRCGQQGHFVRNCPFNSSPNQTQFQFASSASSAAPSFSQP